MRIVDPEGYCNHFEQGFIYKMENGIMIGRYKSG